MSELAPDPDLPQWTMGDRLRKARLHAGIRSTASMGDRLKCHLVSSW